MCDKNINTLVDLIFSAASDENNWTTNASNVIDTTGDGKLRLIADNETTFFDRVIGSLDSNNNRIRVCIDFEVFRPIGSVDSNTTVVFQLLQGSQLIGSGTACITNVESSQRAEFHLDRTFTYENVTDDVTLRINVPTGFGNYIELNDLKIDDFNYCDDDIRTYFVLDQFFEETQNSKAGVIKLLEWKVDDVETLTTDFFADTNTAIIDDSTGWLYADADIDGDNREQDEGSPKSFNPFVKSWLLQFVNPTPYFGGKPTGTENGNDYGPGILNIGVDKPQVLNGNLEPKDGAFFIDIDYTKNLRVVFDAILTEEDDLSNAFYFRRYYIIWDVDKCDCEFYYEDLTSLTKPVPVVDQKVNGFLYGLTDQEIDSEVVACDESISFSGNVGVFEFVLEFGQDVGQAGINYNAFSVPDKFTVIWNNQEFTSGFVGASSFDQQLLNAGVDPSEINTGNPSTGQGQLLFNKTSAFPTTALVRVDAPLGSTGWAISGVCPTVNAQSPLEVGEGDCRGIPASWDEVYVDTPDVQTYEVQNGDVLYTDSGLTTPYNGGGQLHRMRRPSPTGPVILNAEFNVSSAGVISNSDACLVINPPDGIDVTSSNSDSCNSCWKFTVEVPNGETRKVSTISNFVLTGRYGRGNACVVTNDETEIITDTTITITETTDFVVGIDSEQFGFPLDTSQIQVIVRDGNDAFIDATIFEREHGNQIC